MKTLLILRHAKSSWKDESLPDHARPLAKRGLRDAPKMGRLMEHEELLPDLILSSTAHRASQTTVLVKKASGYEGDVLYTDTLYHADTEEILASLREVADEHASVMIVGHNPDLECLVEDLTGEWERLPTAALVEIRLPIEAWAELDDGVEGALARIWIPREVTL